MNDSIFVDVLNTSKYLLHELDGFSLIESFFLDDVVEQLSTFCVFHNEMNVCFSLNDFVQLDNVGMSKYLQNANFAGDAFDVRLLDDFLFLKGFDCHLLFSKDVSAQFNLAKCALANRTAYPVVTQNDLVWS